MLFTAFEIKTHPNALELIHLCVHGLITQLLRYYTEISLKICSYSRREKEFHMSVTGRSLKQHERYSAVCPCFRALLTDVRGHTSDTITPHWCSHEKSKQFAACSDFFLWLSEIYRAAETPSFCSQGFHMRCWETWRLRFNIFASSLFSIAIASVR